ncbi:hypothetical protein MSG28_008187 [Choristoneura fumiferana]|uniref:Uncharacterized protein n=1 Tax=Choristoneura fumiferana TaxID=7141 RepID=A0ACC0JAM1_CHOFU|nr:hypothetical protein MSG28_008187 [Choristoneura fumiferana]
MCRLEMTIMKSARFVLSCRGNPMVHVGGFNFIRERSRGLRTRWVCGRKRRLQCVATVTTIEDKVVKMYGYHNHS